MGRHGGYGVAPTLRGCTCRGRCGSGKQVCRCTEREEGECKGDAGEVVFECQRVGGVYKLHRHGYEMSVILLVAHF